MQLFDNENDDNFHIINHYPKLEKHPEKIKTRLKVVAQAKL